MNIHRLILSLVALALVACAGMVDDVPAPVSPTGRGPWRIVQYDTNKTPIGSWLVSEYKTGPLMQWVEFRGLDGRPVRVSGSISIQEAK